MGRGDSSRFCDGATRAWEEETPLGSATEQRERGKRRAWGGERREKQSSQNAVGHTQTSWHINMPVDFYSYR